MGLEPLAAAAGGILWGQKPPPPTSTPTGPGKDFVPIAPSLAGPFSSPRPTPQSNGSSSSPFSSILHTLISPSPHFRGEGAIGPSTLLPLLPYFAPGVLSISFFLDGQARRRPVRRIPLCWDPWDSRRRNSASAHPTPHIPPPGGVVPISPRPTRLPERF